MISVDEVIKIFIQYRGFRQGLFTDYGSVFDSYLKYYKIELIKCSMFESYNRENTLAIRYRDSCYVIYSTDERAAVWGIEYIYDNDVEATNKYLELYHLSTKLGN